MKTCPRCQTEKVLDAFYLRHGRPSSYCKPCHAAYNRERWRTRPDYRSRVLARQSSQPAKQRRAERLYGMQPGEYAQRLAAQGGVCAICAAPPGAQNLPVDHDHASGRVRGLLCHSCNRAIGLMKDSPAVLRAAADYIERVRT